MTALRQTAALTLLLWRHFRRRALRAGAAPTASGTPSFVILMLVWSGYVGNVVWQMLERARASDGRDNAAGWQLTAVALMVGGAGLGELVPELGRVRSPLRATLLDELPLTTTARLAMAWLRNPLLIALAVLVVFAFSPAHMPSPLALAFGLTFYAASVAWGYAVATAVRVLLPVPWRRALGGAAALLALAGFPLLAGAPSLSGFSPGAVMWRFARALLDGEGLGAATGVAAIWLALALLVVYAGERHGYDRLDAAPTRVRGARGPSSTERIERLLLMRETGRAFLVVELVLLGCATAIAWLAWPARRPEALVDIAFGFGLMLAYFGALAALTQAGAAVRRDAGVRELLAPLPLSPWDTLRGKTAAIRRLLWPLYASALPLLVVAFHHRAALGWDGLLTVSWRAGFALAGVWLAADAAVSVAFLSNGVGLPGARSLGAPTSWAPQLLLLPLLAAAAAPNALTALLSTATVAAVGFEARRAARRCVRWLDDASDDLERETTVWRALLALAAFFAAQALGAQVLHASHLAPSVELPIVYAIAALVLVLLTVRGLKRSGGVRLWPRKPIALAIGLAGGVLSGGFALGLAPLVVKLAPVGDAGLADLDRRWLFAALVVAAPLAEELFFRGWLQTAIAEELPPSRRRWAFLIAALAFGLSHLGSCVVPQLVLGAIAGALFAWSGGLLPGILAHAAHNAIALLLS